MSKKQTIELDCAPGATRPDGLIDGVIKGTKLPKREKTGIFMGNAVWDYNDIPEEDWNESVPIIKERITALYHNGSIRYGSW